MFISRSELQRLIEQCINEDVGPQVPLETLKSVEQKFREILHELPKDFGAMPLVLSAAKAIVNARKAAEGGSRPPS